LAENPSLQEKLRQGIAAAQRGDRLAARRLLQQVLTEDGSNELAWMWMASVVDSSDERRACLERALKLNPNNARAREALRRLGVDVPAPVRTGETQEVDIAPGPARRLRRSNRPLYFALAAALTIILVAIVIGVLLGQGPSDAAVRQTVAAATQFQLAAPNATAAETSTQQPTFVVGVFVTRNPNQNDLPPTFTPTPTEQPSATPPPTATPYPLANFQVFFSAALSGEPQPLLYSIDADGNDEHTLGDGAVSASDIAFSADGSQIAFIRRVLSTGDTLVPQLFVGPADDPSAARQITQIAGTQMSRPGWSPDGTQIVFSSDEDGDEELYVISAEGGPPIKLTDNDAEDSEPIFSLTGREIVFSSDYNTPGSKELYTIPAGGGTLTQLTDASGSSTSPAFSPDGASIAFVSDRSGDNDIYVMDANGQRPFLVTIDDGDADDRSPSWSPDGRWLAFVSNRGRNGFQVYLTTPSGDTLLTVTSGNFNVQSASFQPVTLP